MPKISELDAKTIALNPETDCIPIVDGEADPPQTKKVYIQNLIESAMINIGGLDIWVKGMPDADEVIHKLLPYDIVFPEDFGGSYYYSDVLPTAPVTVSIQKEGTEFGTLVVSALGVATWDCPETTVTAGERITFMFPSIQDVTWGGIAITLKGFVE